MKKQLTLLTILFVLFTACGEDDQPTAADCNGEVCSATVGTDETSANVPSSFHGTFVTEFALAEPNSPVALGTEATFTISANTLVVSIEGRDCFSVENPVHRFGATPTSGNYTFKAACIEDIAFNISANSDGTFSEINLELASGTGFYGQFKVK